MKTTSEDLNVSDISKVVLKLLKGEVFMLKLLKRTRDHAFDFAPLLKNLNKFQYHHLLLKQKSSDAFQSPQARRVTSNKKNVK